MLNMCCDKNKELGDIIHHKELLFCSLNTRTLCAFIASAAVLVLCDSSQSYLLHSFTVRLTLCLMYIRTYWCSDVMYWIQVKYAEVLLRHFI